MTWFDIVYNFLKRPDIEGEKLEAYPDPATKGEPYTIGVGHTGKVRGVRVHLGMTITQLESRQLLRDDIGIADAAVMRHVHVPLNDEERAALASLVFNIGEGNFASSTLLRKLNKGDKQGAADQFPVWNKARVNGVLTEMRGLTNRRKWERLIFLGEYNA